MQSLKTTNLASFTPAGELGELFARAKKHNLINQQLGDLLPKSLKTLSLCNIQEDTATLISDNQALAFRAEKQGSLILNHLQTIEGLAHLQKIVIKVEIKHGMR